LQPAEICRIATILVASAFISRRQQTVKDLRTLIGFGALIVPIFGLIMLQPDFSSIVVTAPALLVLLFAAGVNIFYFFLLFAFSLSAGFFAITWTFIALNPDLADTGKLVRQAHKAAKCVRCFIGKKIVFRIIIWKLLHAESYRPH
jgi:cell division protein FtsW (lipid II flippase)